MTRLTVPTSVRSLVLAATVILVAEVTARVEDYLQFGIPLSRVPDLTSDLIVHDSVGPHGMPNGRYQRWKLNSAGFRSPESVLTPVAGCARVMTLGSSETFGTDTQSPNREYPAQLSDTLAHYGCYQVMNAAIVGFATPSMIQLWNGWAARYHPDIVVILENPMFYLSERAPSFPGPGPAGRQTGGPWWTPRLLDKAQLVVEFPDVIQRLRVQRKLKQLTAGHPDEWFFRSVPADRLAQYRQDLDSLITTVRSHGAEPVLASYPIRFGATPRPEDNDLLAAWRQFSPRATTETMLTFANAAAQAVRELGQERQVVVADLSRIMTGKREWFADFVHYTDAGAAIVAGEIGRTVVGAEAGRLKRVNPSP